MAYTSGMFPAGKKPEPRSSAGVSSFQRLLNLDSRKKQNVGKVPAEGPQGLLLTKEGPWEGRKEHLPEKARQ